MVCGDISFVVCLWVTSHDTNEIDEFWHIYLFIYLYLVEEFLERDKSWQADSEGASLYIRPLLVNCGPLMGIKIVIFSRT